MTAGAWTLTQRDERLLQFLASQGQATAEQLTKLFFPSLQAFYQRGALLIRAGLLESHSAVDCAAATTGGVRGLVSALKLKGNRVQHLKIYRIASQLRKRLPNGNSELCDDRFVKHQLLLSEVRMRIERCLQGRDFQVLNDPEIDAETRTRLYGASLVPDLLFRGADLSIAVELERSVKTESDLALRFSRYRDSRYNKVIYFCESEAIYRRVKKLAGFYRRIAVGFIWGETVYFDRQEMPLADFIKKEVK
ncbi:MAG TPA: replication-relaxation family protein [Bdellovibrionota bacterium]|nr:replication-relaxation family protein [Bdellovibrionota bacterium]